MRALAHRARPFAEKDLTELRQYAAGNWDSTNCSPWDVGYASEKLREQRYAFPNRK